MKKIINSIEASARYAARTSQQARTAYLGFLSPFRLMSAGMGFVALAHVEILNPGEHQSHTDALAVFGNDLCWFKFGSWNPSDLPAICPVNNNKKDP